MKKMLMLSLAVAFGAMIGCCYSSPALPPGNVVLDTVPVDGDIRHMGVGQVWTGTHFNGSCWAVNDYLVVTAYHVVENQSNLWVDSAEAALLAFDPVADVAVLIAPNHGLPPLEFREPRLGEEVYAVGWVGRDVVADDRLSGAHVVRGTISSLNASGWVGFDGGVHPGLSGCPLVGTDGKALGTVCHVAGWDVGLMKTPNPAMGRASAIEWVEFLLDSVLGP